MKRRTLFLGMAGISLGRVASAADAISGQVIGEWRLPNGKVLQALSNGPSAGGNGGNINYWCVALIRRYLQLLEPSYVFPSIGYAYRFFERVSNGEAAFSFLGAFRNESTEPPRPGDILCFRGNKAGHIAVVTDVGDSSITVIEQNWRRNSAIHNIDYLQWKGGHTIASRGNYLVQGWCRVKGQRLVSRPVCLIVDRSESMREEGRFDVVVQLIRRFLESLSDRDEAAIVSFADTGRPDFPFQPVSRIKSQVGDYVRRLEAAGDTNLAAGLAAADAVTAEDQSPYYILISDGGQNLGDYRDVLQGRFVALHRPISVFLFGQRAKREVLREVAAQTGGRYVEAGQVDALTAFTGLIRTLR